MLRRNFMPNSIVTSAQSSGEAASALSTTLLGSVLTSMMEGFRSRYPERRIYFEQWETDSGTFLTTFWLLSPLEVDLFESSTQRQLIPGRLVELTSDGLVTRAISDSSTADHFPALSLSPSTLGALANAWNVSTHVAGDLLTRLGATLQPNDDSQTLSEDEWEEVEDLVDDLNPVQYESLTLNLRRLVENSQNTSSTDGRSTKQTLLHFPARHQREPNS